MPLFEYRVRSVSGQLERGVRKSNSAEELGAVLIQENVFPIDIREVSESKTWRERFREVYYRALHNEELALFARHMHTLCEADVPLALCLSELAKQTRSPILAECLPKIVERVEQGEPLSSALGAYAEVFPPLAVHILKVGEDSGKLAKAFLDLHEYLQFEQSNRKQIEGTMRYPIFILVSVLSVIGILNVFIVPNFANFYAGSGMKLPWQTEFLLKSSHFFVNYGLYFLSLLVLSIFLIRRYIKTSEGQLAFGKFQLSVPIFGKLSRKILLIRISHSLGVMLASGISIVPALKLIRPIAGNAYIADQLYELRNRLERGLPLIEAMQVVSLFSSVEILMLSVGEKKGELHSALHYISSLHAQELPYHLKSLNEAIGIVLTLSVSLLILFVAMGIYMPIWNMVDLTKTH